jgi:hypothetical protein
MHVARSIAAAALCGLVAACAGYTPSVAKEERPSANDAYLYGRFQIATGSFMHMINQTMGFVFKCDDQKTYTLRFEKEEPLQVVKIAPSTCTLAEIVYSDANGVMRKPMRGDGQKFAPFAAGKAYYLGDFYAETKTSTQGGMTHREWHVTNVINAYASTTEKLRVIYPNVGGLPTENRFQ